MARRFPTAFAERNRVVLAVVGLIALAATFMATFNADDLPVIGGGEEHQAYFAETAGLKAGNEVRAGGVKVGKITGIDLDGDKVLVTFRVKGIELGRESRAAIKIKTLLGQKYLSVSNAGGGELDEPIALDHTTTPYDVQAAFSQLSDNLSSIDTSQLEDSFDALSTAFENTPASVRATVDGLTRLSRTISSRDDDLAKLFTASTKVTDTVAARDTELGKLIDDGDLLLTELAQRRESIRQLLKATGELGVQIKGLVADNQKQLQPALQKLDRVAALLRKNQQNLSDAVAKLGPYYRMLAGVTGNGRWVDSYICGLFDGQNNQVLDDSVLRDCRPGGVR